MKSLALQVALLLLRTGLAPAQQPGDAFRPAHVNAGILASARNQNASIVLTTVPDRLFLNGDATDAEVVAWQPSDLTCELRYDTAPGNRDLQNNYPNRISAMGTGSLILNPGAEGMSTGVYYCILVSDEDDSVTSVEFNVVVQANLTPTTVSPQGTVTLNQGAPLFRWNPVEGVPYYFLLLSEGAVSIERNAEGEITGLSGLNVIWQAITPASFIQYGAPDPSGTFLNAHIPPLLPGIEYNWIVLNSYSADGRFISGSVAPVAPEFFSINRPTLPQAPNLLAPEANAILASDTITFRWQAVENISRYRLLLYETRDVNDSEVSYPVWSQVTSATELVLATDGLLIDTSYHWRIVAENQNGLSTSAYRPFKKVAASGTITFMVTSDEGPLPRVKFDVRNENQTRVLVPFITDTLGISETVLPAGNYTYTASLPGFLTSPEGSFSVQDGGTETVFLNLERSATTVSGRVTDTQGKGIFNAIATLRSGNALETTTTDERGYFTIAARPGDWSLRVRKLGYAASTPLDMTLSDAEAFEIDALTLAKAGNTVSGQVIFAADNRPLQGVRIRASNGDITYETATTMQGGFSLKLDAGIWEISLDTQGYFAQPSRYTFDLQDSQQVSAPFQLFSEALLYGKVTLLNRGVAGAKVTAFAATTDQLIQTTETNLQGNYSLGLPAGTYDVHISLPKFLDEHKTVTVASGETVVENFVLTEAGFVEGRAINVETASPLQGVRIHALEDSSFNTISDATGSYSLTLPPGRQWQIDASLPGFASNGPLAVSPHSGEHLSGQDFFLSPLSSILRGQVTDGTAPLPGVTVAVEQAGVQALTDSEGRFEFELAPGVYDIHYSKACHFAMSQHIEIAAGDVREMQIVLQPLQSVITGRVTDTDGVPILSARVEASGDTTFSVTSDSAGFYELCLNSGIFRVTAAKAGYFPADTTLVVNDGDVHAGIDFLLRESFASLTGTVTDTGGNPMPSATVELINADRRLTVTTGIDGRFGFQRIIAGPATVRAIKHNLYGRRHDIFFQHLEQVQKDLTLFPADGFITGAARNSGDSTGIADVQISALFSEDSQAFFSARTDTNGGYALLNLPVVPGTHYQVFAFKEEFASPAPKLNVAPKSDSVDFFLVSKIGSIAGVVQDADTGLPIKEVLVRAANAVGGRGTAFTDEGGRFEVLTLDPTQQYTLTTERNGYFSNSVQGVLPGDSTVVIEILRKYGFVGGRISDLNSGSALANVLVQATPLGVSGKAVETLTDANGDYFLRLVADFYSIQPAQPYNRSTPAFLQIEVIEVDTARNIDFTLEAQTVQAIAIQRADQTIQPAISNHEEHCYEAFARDDQNRPVQMASPMWSLDVSPEAATIDSAGCVTIDSAYFGDLVISVTDPRSGTIGELPVQVFAPIDSGTAITLSNARGLRLEIRPGAVLTPKELFVSKTVVANAKKGRAEYSLTDSSFVLKPAGLTFDQPVTLMLPPPANTEGQQQRIARWHPKNSEWTLLPGVLRGGVVVANITETGEYAALALSKPLDIGDLTLLPNPFSPFVQTNGQNGLSMMFNISSDAAPTPLVTVKIYNLEGNLVRLLHDQTPFPKGHSIIHWDGRTDNALLARNGRYIVRVVVEDPAGKIEKIKSVVLVK